MSCELDFDDFWAQVEADKKANLPEHIDAIAKQCVTMSFYVDTASENFDYKKFAMLLGQKVLTLQNRHGNIKPRRVKEYFGL